MALEPAKHRKLPRVEGDFLPPQAQRLALPTANAEKRPTQLASQLVPSRLTTGRTALVGVGLPRVAVT